MSLDAWLPDDGVAPGVECDGIGRYPVAHIAAPVPRMALSMKALSSLPRGRESEDATEAG